MAATDLPTPPAELQAHSDRLLDLIRAEIEASGGAIPFHHFMRSALYQPGLGYYVAGAPKLGQGGDFVTAPELSSLFGRCLARQAGQVLEMVGGGDILEFGAGSGRLAADVLAELDALNRLPERYLILEVSPELRQRQGETLAQLPRDLASRVQWLDAMPEQSLRGLVLANEVLDAMPVHRFRIVGSGYQEQFVTADAAGLGSTWGEPVSAGLVEALDRLAPSLSGLPSGYQSELNPQLPAWIDALSQTLEQGAALLIDYGFSRGEYYHPQRDTGTLICHYQQRAHPDALYLPGGQDITASVDFTAVAEAASAAGMTVAGFTSQAFFLFGCGLERLMAESDPVNLRAHLPLVQQVKTLTLPTEMGERFKVMSLTRGLGQALLGHSLRNDLATL